MDTWFCPHCSEIIPDHRLACLKCGAVKGWAKDAMRLDVGDSPKPRAFNFAPLIVLAILFALLCVYGWSYNKNHPPPPPTYQEEF